MTYSLYCAIAQIVNEEPLSGRETCYKINATLDPDSKTVIGEMEAYWVNKSSDIVPDIQLHLYMNAFKNNKSTYSQGRIPSSYDKKSDFGWIELKSFEDGKGNNLLGRFTYISPDDNNPDDQTVIKMIPEKPAKPGDTVFIKSKI